MRRVMFESEKDTNIIYIKPNVHDDYDLDGELYGGLLLAQGEEGRVYILDHDQAAGSNDDDDSDDPHLVWHRLGACEVRDGGEAFWNWATAIRWALDQGWWVWHARDSAEAQKWIGEQLRKAQTKRQGRNEEVVGGV